MTAIRSRADTAYQALRQCIIEQALPPGTRLPEDVIGSQFGMSRTLARATLARLQLEGLVEAGRKRTATVARPSLEEAKEDFEVRRALEREVIRLVVARWKPEFGAVLEGHVREEEQAKVRGDARVSIRLAGEFHIRLAEMSGNRLLQRYLSEVVSRCSLILALYGRRIRLNARSPNIARSSRRCAAAMPRPPPPSWTTTSDRSRSARSSASRSSTSAPCCRAMRRASRRPGVQRR